MAAAPLPKKLKVTRPGGQANCFPCSARHALLAPDKAFSRHEQVSSVQCLAGMPEILSNAQHWKFNLQGCASVRPTRRHGPDWHGTVRHGADTARHGPAWRGLAWPIEVRGMASRSEGLANRSGGSGLAGLANRNEGLGWPGLANRSEGLGWPGLANRSEGWAGRAWPIEVRGWPMEVSGWAGRPGQ